MTTPRHYSRPPITEAIIDFQAELPTGVGESDLERCQDRAYPGKEILNVTTLEAVDLDGEGPPSTTISRQRGGFRFTSTDGKQLYQARSNGFTVHRLAPYQGWVQFRDEARRLWKVYREVARPQRVKRIAVRYINRLDLPAPAELKDYLRTFPEVSPDLPQGLAGFFLQLNIPQGDIKSTLLLRETVVPATAEGVVSVILDIDLFRSEEIPSDDAGIWAFIDSLRTRKNDVFEACIADRTRELIQ